MNNKKGFTLVELIIVITILAVLTTVAFMSFKGYSQSSKDAVRASDMKSLETALDIYKLKNSKIPKPDNSINITASGFVLNLQGEAGELVLGTIGVYGGGKDPSNDSYYTYVTNSSLNKYQVLGFMEESLNLSVIKSTFAYTYNDKIPVTLGDDLGVLLNSTDNTPINLEETSVSITNNLNNFKLIKNNNIELIGDGNTVYKNIYNSRKNLFNNKDLAQYDNDLLGYWDMETLINSAGIDYVKDLSGNGNIGECIDYNTTVDCNGVSGPKIGEGIIGKSLNFDGVDDYFEVPSLFDANFPLTGTLNFSIKSNLNNQPQKSIFDFYNSSRNHIFLRTTNTINDVQIAYQSDPLNSYVFVHTSSFNTSDFINFSLSWSEDKNIKYYINGILVNEVTISEDWLPNQQNFRFFGSDNSSFNLKGNLDEVRLYNKVLSDTEVENIYNYQSN